MAITSIAGNSKIFNNLNSFCSLSVTSIKNHVPIYSLSFTPNSYGYCIKSTRLSSNYGRRRASEHVFRVPMVLCVVEDTSETQPESGNSSTSSDSSKEAAINLKLP